MTDTPEATTQDPPSPTLPGRRIRNTRDLTQVRFRSDGLVPVITQHARTDEVLMLAYANRTALALTLDTGQMYYWSRSRKEIWRKGATSGNVLSLVSLYLDCDADAVLAKVRPAGPVCHTLARTCFVEPGTEASKPKVGPPEEPDPGERPPPTVRGSQVLDDLWVTLRARAEEMPPGSHTARLLDDSNLRLKKLGEELVELIVALTRRDPAAVTREAADLVYHLMVALMGAGVSLHAVGAELARRAGDDPTPTKE